MLNIELKKRVNLVIEKLNQRLIAKKAKVKKYDKGFHTLDKTNYLGKTNYFKSTRNRCTKSERRKTR